MTKQPIWDKGNATVDERIMRFMAGEDVVLDRQLFLYDIRASKAHVRGLERIGILEPDECSSLIEMLSDLAGAFRDETAISTLNHGHGNTPSDFHIQSTDGLLSSGYHTA